MFFDRYGNMTRRDRAMLDGMFITYCFYVAFVTLALLGIAALYRGDSNAVLPFFMSGMSLVVGVGLHVTHRRFLKSSHAETYLETVTAVLGAHTVPLVPILFVVISVVSTLFLLLYLL